MYQACILALWVIFLANLNRFIGWRLFCAVHVLYVLWFQFRHLANEPWEDLLLDLLVATFLALDRLWKCLHCKALGSGEWGAQSLQQELSAWRDSVVGFPPHEIWDAHQQCCPGRRAVARGWTIKESDWTCCLRYQTVVLYPAFVILTLSPGSLSLGFIGQRLWFLSGTPFLINSTFLLAVVSLDCLDLQSLKRLGF